MVMRVLSGFQVTAADFLQSPSPVMFLALRANKSQQIMDEIQVSLVIIDCSNLHNGENVSLVIQWLLVCQKSSLNIFLFLKFCYKIGTFPCCLLLYGTKKIILVKGISMWLDEIVNNLLSCFVPNTYAEMV